MMRRSLAPLFCALALSVQPWHMALAADPPATMILKDTSWLALTPLEQLKKLGALKTENKIPADFTEARREALIRYLHAESKGKAADEIKAYQKLTVDKQSTIQGLEFQANFESPLIDFSYYAALLNEPTWQTGTAREKLDLLATWYERDRINLQNETSYLGEWVILEHLNQKSAGVPVKDRGMVKLKALGELASGIPVGGKSNEADGSGASWIWNQCLFEHLAMHPDWPTMKNEDRVAYLAKLRTDIKMNNWAGLEPIGYYAQLTLDENPAYKSGDAAAKKKLVKELVKKHKIPDFAGMVLEAAADGKLRTTNSAKPLTSLAAELQGVNDPMALLDKVRAIQKDKAVLETEYATLSQLKAYAFLLSGDPNKPLTPAAEVAKWKELGNDASKTPLKLIDRNGSGGIDWPAILAAMMSDPTYAKGTWTDRYKLLAKQQAAYYDFGSPFYRPRSVLLNLAIAQEAMNTPPAARGEAMLKAHQKITAAHGPNFRADSPDRRVVDSAISRVFAEKKTPPAGRFAIINGYMKQNLIAKGASDDALKSAAISMLSADASFMAAAPAAKKAKIDAMEKSKQIEWSLANDLKRHFKCE